MRLIARLLGLLVLVGTAQITVGCIDVNDVTTACANDPSQCDGVDSSVDDSIVDADPRADASISDVRADAADSKVAGEASVDVGVDGESGSPDACKAITTCATGDECGTNPDGCGSLVACGSCSGTKSCNTATHKCETVCSPITTCPSGACGVIDNGCATGTLSCAGCGSGLTCSPVSHTCVCVPLTACPSGHVCGTYPDGCGGSISCGSCKAPQTCDASGACGGCGATLPGPAMVDVSGYCIDSTEVTQAQYKTFVDAKGSDTTGQPASCTSNTSYAAYATWFDPSVHPTYPVRGVDWCDATAYCAWAGKRLCGAVGGGTLADADKLSTAKNQWLSACTTAGVWTYPYGANIYYPDQCCDSGSGRSAACTNVVNVSSFTGCDRFVSTSASAQRIYDLSGNVWEWIDYCSSGRCYSMGGGYSNPETMVKCSSLYGNPPSTVWADVGFRCCAP